MDFIINFDFSILDFIASNIRSDFLDPIMTAFSLFADKGLGWAVLALIFLIPKKTRPAAATALTAMVIALVLGNFVLKGLVARPRPFEVYESYHNAPMAFTLNMGKPTGFSFPSVHTCFSFAFAAAMFKWCKTAGIISLIAAAIVGFSRLYNYVHFPTDVLAGAVVGLVAAAIAVFIFKKFNFDEKLLNIGKKK